MEIIKSSILSLWNSEQDINLLVAKNFLPGADGGYNAKVDNFLKDIKDKRSYNVANGDVISFYPNASVPRFKLKQFCEKNKCYVTRSPEKANAIFIDKKCFNNIIYNGYFTLTRYKFISKKKLVDIGILKKLEEIQDSVDKHNLANFKKCIANIIIADDDHHFLLNTWSFNRLTNLDLLEEFPSLTNDHEVSPEDNLIGLKDDSDTSKFIDMIINHIDKTYISQDLLSHINTEVITRERYDMLCRMFNGGEDNRALAIEAIANSDYDQSALYIFTLLSNNYYSIRNAKETKMVNFKAMLNYFDITINDIGRWDINAVFKKLRENKLVNYKVLTELLELHHIELSDLNVVETKEELNNLILDEMSDCKINDDILNTIVCSKFNDEEINPKAF